MVWNIQTVTTEICDFFFTLTQPMGNVIKSLYRLGVDLMQQEGTSNPQYSIINILSTVDSSYSAVPLIWSDCRLTNILILFVANGIFRANHMGMVRYQNSMRPPSPVSHNSTSSWQKVCQLQPCVWTFLQFHLPWWEVRFWGLATPTCFDHSKSFW